MQKVHFLTCIILSLVLFSCDKDDDAQQSSYTDINIVTGLNLVDDNGQTFGTWKSPNDKLGSVSVFPNPAFGFIQVYSQEEIIKIWLTPADCFTEETENIPTLSQNLNFTVAEVEAVQIKEIPGSAVTGSITINLSDLSDGFYKIFYELPSGDLFWTNLYLSPNSSGIASIEDLDNACD